MVFAVLRQKSELSAARKNTDLALSYEQLPYRVWSLADLALLEYETGDGAAGGALLKEVIDKADHTELVFKWEGWLTLLIAYIAWVTGELMPFDAAETAAARVPIAGGLRRGDAVTVSAGLGLVAAFRADREAASKYYQDLLPYRGLVVCPYLGMTADHLLALLASAAGDDVQATVHFDATMAFCRTNGLAFELAYCCRDYAEFLFRSSPRIAGERIQELCHEAGPIAEKARAIRLVQRLDRVRAAASKSRPRGKRSPDSLSERELDVLRLLSRGLSNAQIGDKLFISVHTVANHVQSILEKTGAANRTEAAAYAIRHVLTEPDSRQ
jgi:DNA-binding CsgD family transcriptional regulator